MSAVLLELRIGLAAVFAVAAAGKLLNRERFREALGDFGVPQRLTGAGSVVIPLLEGAVAAGLLADSTARYAAAGAAALLIAFCVAIALANARGEQPDCNCFGQVASAPAGPRTLVRNAALAGIALLVVIAGPGDSLADVSALAIVAAVVAAQAWFSWELFRQNGRLLERVRALEEAPRGGGTAAGGPQGLGIGEGAPPFSLRRADGGSGGLRDLLGLGRPVAIAFSDSGCGACDELPSLLERMRAVREGELTLALLIRVHGDDREAHLRGSGGETFHLEDDVLFAAYGILRLPSLVIVSDTGRIASPTVAGLEGIEELLATAGGKPTLEVLTRR